MKILRCKKVLFYFTTLCILSCYGWVVQNSVAFAEQAPKAAKDQLENSPLHITSNKMIAMKNQSMVEFTGQVKAVQKDAVLTADSVKIYFDSDTDPMEGQGSIKKIVAAGNVVYTTGNRKAFADNAVYTTLDQKLVLTGDSTRLVSGTSFVAGKKITLFRNDDRMVVESDEKKRVTARFDPEDAPQE